MRRKVFVGVPTDDFKVSAHLCAFLTALERLNFLEPHPNTYEMFFALGARPVEYARNVVVGQFLKSSAEWLWFLDSDIVPPDDWDQMFSVDADVVCGRSTFLGPDDKTKGPAIGVNTFLRSEGGFKICGTDEITPEIDACGTACLLIHRRVFEDARVMLPGESVEPLTGVHFSTSDSKDGQNYAPPFFRTHYASNGQRMFGEDLDFTWRCKNLGFRVAAAPTSIWDQSKMVPLLGVARYAAQVAREQAGSEA